MIDENARKQQDWTADRRFHIAIARATRNTAIASVIENLLDMAAQVSAVRLHVGTRAPRWSTSRA